MQSELFQSHYNPQNLAKTLPTTSQPTSEPPIPPEPVKPATTIEPTPALAKGSSVAKSKSA